MNPAHPYLNPQENPANALNRLLQTEADITHAMAEVHAVMVDNFFTRNPHLPRYPDLMPAAHDTAQLLAEYDKHYYFPLGRLLQQLPGDITNQPRLSQEQGQMCLALSGFAAQAVATIQNGLAAMEAAMGKTVASDSMPDLQRLLDYLQAECGFMQTCEGDYRDAANHIVRAG